GRGPCVTAARATAPLARARRLLRSRLRGHLIARLRAETLALRRRLIRLLRLAETAAPSIVLGEVLDAVTRHLHLRLPLVHVSARHVAGDDHRVSLADAETRDQ